jgi:hypothetical protein
VKIVLPVLILAFVVSGCASYVETTRIDPNTLETTGSRVQGVIYYEAKLVKVRYEFTQLVDKDKGVIGTSDSGTCKQVIQKEEIITLPDYQNPRAILHKPSMFSSSEFGVTLNNGMLVSVTSKSTPQTPQILEQVAALKDAGVLGMPFVAGCNAGPVITKQEIVKL